MLINFSPLFSFSNSLKVIVAISRVTNHGVWSMLTLLLKLVNDEAGVTAIEYSLIAALIAVAAIASFTLIGTNLSTTFSTIAGKL
jgi:pilus assembly protein Flp/PilA